jgi:hypothetical protein
MPPRPNVIVFVLDTLREDCSAGLRGLSDRLGFVKYSDAIAPSTWTLPSHVSLFTGLMPSQHGIHEDRSVGIETMVTQASIREEVRSQNESLERGGLIGRLGARGYRTYALTANTFVLPFFGFPFDEVHLYDDLGEVSEGRWEPRGDRNRLLQLLWYLKRGSPSIIWRQLVLQRMANVAPSLFHWFTCEKGTKHIVRDLKTMRLKEPFLLFVNMMEAHEPYVLGEVNPCREIAFSMITGKRPSVHPDWRLRYRSHSEIPVQGAIAAVKALEPYLPRSITMVTSDHGQLLGEKGRFGHGFTLDDEVLRVPFYARYPEWASPIRQSGRFLSLTSVPSIVDAVAGGTELRLGSDTAAAESFGPIWSLRRFAKSARDAELLGAAYSHKVRLFSGSGSATYNVSTDIIEELGGAESEGEARESLRQLPIGATTPRAAG